MTTQAGAGRERIPGGGGGGGYALAGPRSHTQTRGTADVMGTWPQKTHSGHHTRSRARSPAMGEGRPKAGTASLLTW